MPNVTIYSTKTCAFCSMVKRFLSHKNIPFSEINLDDHPEKREEAYRLSGARSVPMTYIKNGEKESVVLGYAPAKIMQALAV